MTQMIKKQGKIYKFPDDASLDEINNFFHDDFKSSLSSSIKSMLPTMPHGLNVATGMMSLAFPGEQAELVKNLPQAMTGTQPSTSQKIEQFAGEMLPGMEVGPQAAAKTAKAVGKGLEYIQPQKEIPKLMEKLGGGAKTSEENIANLSSEVSGGRIAQEEEALVPKREFLEKTKGKHILEKGISEIPNLGKVARIFGAKLDDLSQHGLETLGNEVKNYFKEGGSIEKLTYKLEDLFGHSGLNASEMTKLEEALPFGKLRASRYLGSKEATKGYSEGLKDLHEAFARKKTPENIDKLLSGIKRERRILEETAEKVGWNNTSQNKYARLGKNLDNLTSDFTQFINELPPELRGKYKDFTQKWKLNAAIYGADKTIEALSKGKHLGLTQAQIAKAFSNPTKDTIKILGDIGEPGKGHLLYNFLQKMNPKQVDKFANAILDAKKTKGYSHYVTPELEAWANNIMRRQKARVVTEDVALGLASLPIMGPMGAIGAVGAKHAIPYLGSAFKRMMGK